MRNKRRKIGILCGVLLPGLALLGSLKLGAEAKEKDAYTYRAVFHAGVQGTFRGTDEVKIELSAGAAREEGPRTVLSEDGKTITVSGLYPGDRISFDVALMDAETEADPEAAAEGESTRAVQLADGSRYYVKGLLKSGRDGKDALDAALPAGGVQGDLDYVVSYGIRGDMTSYRVNYRDASGRELAPSRKYSGNVGDRPVAAYLYMDGYRPQAYNLTKTLAKNEAENEMTFIYTPVRQGGSSGGSGSGTGTGTGAGTGTVEIVETEETVIVPGGAAGIVPGGAAGVAAQPEAGMEALQDEGAVQNEEEIQDEQVPLELLDLDDEETPLATAGTAGLEGSRDGEQPGGSVMYALAAVAVTGTAVLIGFVLWAWKRRKKEKEA